MPLEAETRATPRPTGSEVLLQVVAAGMCHSDVHLWDGGYDLGRGKKLFVKDRGVSLPLTLGHETVGEVLELGPDAHGVKCGETYLVYPWVGCGSCAVCRDGDENLCAKPRSIGIYRDGGYADHMIVPHPRYLLGLSGLDPISAAPYACSGLTTYSALKKAGSTILREPVVIIGAGGLGLMSLGLLKAMGGAGAVVVEVDEHKRTAALAAGAISVIDGNEPDAMDQIVRAIGASPRIVIDFVGSEQTAALAFNSVAKGGTLITVGLFGGAAPWSLPLIPIRAITIQGSYVGNLAELTELLDLVRRKNVPAIPIMRTLLDDANQMLENLRLGKVVGRAVLTP